MFTIANNHRIPLRLWCFDMLNQWIFHAGFEFIIISNLINFGEYFDQVNRSKSKTDFLKHVAFWKIFKTWFQILIWRFYWIVKLGFCQFGYFHFSKQITKVFCFCENVNLETIILYRMQLVSIQIMISHMLFSISGLYFRNFSKFC